MASLNVWERSSARYFVCISSSESFIRVSIMLEVKEKAPQRDMSVGFCLRKRGNAAHFQFINTADRACWRKPHYAAGSWVGWARRRGWGDIMIQWREESASGDTISFLSLSVAAAILSLVITEHHAVLSSLHRAKALFLWVWAASNAKRKEEKKKKSVI